MAFDASTIYNDPETSDVTITFSGTSVHCHKLILGASSDYFKKLCSPNSGFAESTRREIELKEDDPDAVAYLLQHLYAVETSNTPSQINDWILQLQVANAAHKYLLPLLTADALYHFKRTTRKICDTTEAFSAITYIRESTLLPEALKVADDLEGKHLHSLLKLREYRKLVEQDINVLWKHIDRLNNKLSGQRDADLQVCRGCRRTKLLSTTMKSSKCPCMDDFDKDDYTRLRVWVPKDDIKEYRGQLKY